MKNALTATVLTIGYGAVLVVMLGMFAEEIVAGVRRVRCWWGRHREERRWRRQWRAVAQERRTAETAAFLAVHFPCDPNADLFEATERWLDLKAENDLMGFWN